MMRFIRGAIALALVAAMSVPAFAATNDWQSRVAAAFGKPGIAMPGGLYRIALPRTDLKVMLDGVRVKPALALGGWLAFEKTAAGAMVMGDLVLTQDEVSPVMKKLLAEGIEVTALHNHLLHNRPFTMYMHVMGRGDPAKLATMLRAALAKSHTPLVAPPPPSPPVKAQRFPLDAAALDRILGAKGKIVGGVDQFSIPRAGPITEDGVKVPPAMGTGNAINFQPTGGGKAAITGDFVLTGNEVNPVLKALVTHGIAVTAIHNHMIGEKPRLFFVHFWANADAGKLAQGLKAALAHAGTAAR
jgi:hypothetical protein